MKGGLVALISILGVSWLGSSFFEGNQQAIVGGISSAIQSHPWVFALGLFALSVLLFSQAATVVTLVPVGAGARPARALLVGAYAAVNGIFFLPTYGTVLAAVSFDQTGHHADRQVSAQPQLHAAGVGRYRERHRRRDGARPMAIGVTHESPFSKPRQGGQHEQKKSRSFRSLAVVVALCFSRRPRQRQQKFRVEKDLLGEKQVPAEAYWGVQTARALENFQISGIPITTTRGSSRR